MDQDLQIFLVTQPGFEQGLAQEAKEIGLKVSATVKGGVTCNGGWVDVMRANLMLRGATRVLVRIASFPAVHLAQLNKRAKKLPWQNWLNSRVSVRVDCTCRKSKIYHSKAAQQRVETAIVEACGAKISDEADINVKVRIEDNICTFSLDTSGEALHKRGHKAELNKAPMRETMAAMFLRAAGFDGSFPVFDPMCGSGTFPIEAAEIASGVFPGRSRSFAFEKLASFDPNVFASLSAPETKPVTFKYYGSDRDAGAVEISTKNAARAGVDHLTRFETKSISEATPPSETPGLVIVNPPYGARVGNKKPLFALYGSFGRAMRERFAGWRVAMITPDEKLARATGLSWAAPGPAIDHGGIRVRLWQTEIN